MPCHGGYYKISNRKRYWMFIGLLLLLVLPAGAEKKGKFVFGAYGGWSFGLGDEFRWYGRSFYSYVYDLRYHFGGYVQYDLSGRFGLQLNVNYQGVTHRWIHASNQLTGPVSGSDGTHVTSFNLNAVVNCLRLKRALFYLLGGAGICDGQLYRLYGSFMNFTGGTGVKVYLQANSRSAINLGGSFHHLLKPEKHANVPDAHADYLRFQVGYEFSPK